MFPLGSSMLDASPSPGPSASSLASMSAPVFPKLEYPIALSAPTAANTSVRTMQVITWLQEAANRVRGIPLFAPFADYLESGAAIHEDLVDIALYKRQFVDYTVEEIAGLTAQNLKHKSTVRAQSQSIKSILSANVHGALGPNARALMNSRPTYIAAKNTCDVPMMLDLICSLFESSSPKDHDTQQAVKAAGAVFAKDGNGQFANEPLTLLLVRFQRTYNRAMHLGIISKTNASKPAGESVKAEIFVTHWLHSSYQSFVEKMLTANTMSGSMFASANAVVDTLLSLGAPMLPVSGAATDVVMSAMFLDQETRQTMFEMGYAAMPLTPSAQHGARTPGASKAPRGNVGSARGTAWSGCRHCNADGKPGIASHYKSECPSATQEERAQFKKDYEKRQEDFKKKREKTRAKGSPAASAPAAQQTAMVVYGAPAAQTEAQQIVELTRKLAAMKTGLAGIGIDIAMSAIVHHEQIHSLSDSSGPMRFLDCAATISTQGGPSDESQLEKLEKDVPILGVGGFVIAKHRAKDDEVRGIRSLHLPEQSISLSSLGQSTMRQYCLVQCFFGRWQALVPRHHLDYKEALGYIFLRQKNMYPLFSSFRIDDNQLVVVDRDSRVTHDEYWDDKAQRDMTSRLVAGWNAARSCGCGPSAEPAALSQAFKAGDLHGTAVEPKVAEPPLVDKPDALCFANDASARPSGPSSAARKAVEACEDVDASSNTISRAALLRAKLSRLATRSLMTQPAKLKELVSKGGLRDLDLDFTVKDIEVADQVFGDNGAALLTNHKARPPHTFKGPDGKPTRCRIYPSRDPSDEKNDAISSDVMEVAGVKLLTSKVDKMGMHLLSPISDDTGLELADKAVTQINTLQSKGVRVDTMHCDQGTNFMSQVVKDDLRKLGVERQSVAKSAHVVSAEATIRPAREAILSTLALIAQRYSGDGHELEAPPSAWMNSIVLHYQNAHAYTLEAAGNLGLTPGQMFHGRDLTPLELAWEPGAFAMAKIPEGVHTHKDAERSEPVVFLANLVSPTCTALVWSFSHGRVIVREINELRPVKITDHAKAAVRQMYLQDVTDGKALRVPKSPFPLSADGLVGDDITVLADRAAAVEELVEATSGDESKQSKKPDAQTAMGPFITTLLTKLKLGLHPDEESAARNRGETSAGGNRGADAYAAGTYLRKEFDTGTFVGRIVKVEKRGIQKIHWVLFDDGDLRQYTAKEVKGFIAVHGPVSPADQRQWEHDVLDADTSKFAAMTAIHEVLDDVEQAYQDSVDEARSSPGFEKVMTAQHRMRTLLTVKAIMRKDHLALHKAFSMNIEQALEAYPDIARESVKTELESLLRKALTPVDWSKLSLTHKRFLVPSKLFLKEKKDAEGNVTSLKARAVAGGHRQNRDGLGDVSSPTLSLTSMFAMFATQTYLKQVAVTVDFPSAFLFSPQPEKDDPVYMALDKKTSALAVEMFPELLKMVDEKGRIICLCHHGVYGLAKSSWLWYDLLTKTLRSMGYEHNPYDTCVMNKKVGGTLVSVMIYVDDCRFQSVSRKLIMSDVGHLQSIFGKEKPLTVKEGHKQLYLGMDLDTSIEGEMRITMNGYLKELLSDMAITVSKPTPANEQLFEVDESSPKLDEGARGKFVTAVMRLYYLAKRIRSDVLTACSFLSRRSTVATAEDWDKLEHLLKYLNGTRDYALVLRPGNNLHIHAFVDASFGTHFDRKSNTGTFIRLGEAGGCVYCRSAKQLATSLSSMQAELIALSDSAKQVLWLRNFLIGQGLEEAQQPATIHQDNQATIAAMSTRKITEKSRFIQIRWFWLKEHLNSGDAHLKYCPTNQMLADMLTKPLQGATFCGFRDQVLQKP